MQGEFIEGGVISPADCFFKCVRLSNVLYTYSEKKNVYTSYLEYIFDQRVTIKWNLLSLRLNKSLKTTFGV